MLGSTCGVLENLSYVQKEMPLGSALMNHAVRPHGGPGNESKTQWRFLLFLVFALDQSASPHYADEEVLWS